MASHVPPGTRKHLPGRQDDASAIQRKAPARLSAGGRRLQAARGFQVYRDRKYCRRKTFVQRREQPSHCDAAYTEEPGPGGSGPTGRCPRSDRKRGVLGKSVSASVDLGGRRIIKKTKTNKIDNCG